MNLFKVSLFVTPTVISRKVIKYIAKESKETYTIKDVSTHRIKKESLLQPITMFNIGVDLQAWYSFCKEEDIEKAKEILENKVSDELQGMQRLLLLTIDNFQDRRKINWITKDEAKESSL